MRQLTNRHDTAGQCHRQRSVPQGAARVCFSSLSFGLGVWLLNAFGNLINVIAGIKNCYNNNANNKLQPNVARLAGPIDSPITFLVEGRWTWTRLHKRAAVIKDTVYLGVRVCVCVHVFKKVT